MVVWRDIHLKGIIYVLCFIIFFLLGIYLIIQRDEKIQGIIATIISFFFIFNLFRTKLSYVNSDGIRIGNAPDDRYQHIHLKNKAIFLKWKNISYVEIFRKEVKRPLFMDLIHYVGIKTKTGKKHVCFIADPKGFVNAMKKMSKGNLIRKVKF